VKQKLAPMIESNFTESIISTLHVPRKSTEIRLIQSDGWGAVKMAHPLSALSMMEKLYPK
jgi:hypothetical protein